MKVLVVYGTRLGGSVDLAKTIAATLSEKGHEVDLRAARARLHELHAYDAVIVGGGVAAGFWPAATRRFIVHHRRELSHLHVWCFSSGPLDRSASEKTIAPSPHIARLVESIHARGHVTFGGRLDPRTKGFIAGQLIKRGLAGDYRDFEQVKAWSRSVADELHTLPVSSHTRAPREDRVHQLVTALCLFSGVTAILGGLQLAALSPSSRWLPPIAVLEHSPFTSFVAPGLLLLLLVGVPNLVAGILETVESSIAEWVAIAGGVALSVWSVVEMALVRAPSLLEAINVMVGLTTAAAAAWLVKHQREATPRLARSRNAR